MWISRTCQYPYFLSVLTLSSNACLGMAGDIFWWSDQTFGVVLSSVFHAAVFWNVTPCSLVETPPTLRTYVIPPSFTHLHPTWSYSSWSPPREPPVSRVHVYYPFGEHCFSPRNLTTFFFSPVCPIPVIIGLRVRRIPTITIIYNSAHDVISDQ